MMILVIACVAAIFYAQYYINVNVKDKEERSGGSTATSIASAIQIQILTYFYYDIAIGFNNTIGLFLFM
jgi:hypothetical protein